MSNIPPLPICINIKQRRAQMNFSVQTRSYLLLCWCQLDDNNDDDEQLIRFLVHALIYLFVFVQYVKILKNNQPTFCTVYSLDNDPTMPVVRIDSFSSPICLFLFISKNDHQHTIHTGGASACCRLLHFVTKSFFKRNYIYVRCIDLKDQ